MFFKSLNDWLAQYADYGQLLLRVVVGVTFIAHGYSKLFGALGMDAWTGMLVSLGVPAAPVMAYVVAGIEFLGGVAVLLGIFTRLASLLLAAVMVGAIVLVHAKNGFFLPNGYEFALVLLATTLALAVRGHGKYLSLEEMVCKK